MVYAKYYIAHHWFEPFHLGFSRTSWKGVVKSEYDLASTFVSSKIEFKNASFYFFDFQKNEK